MSLSVNELAELIQANRALVEEIRGAVGSAREPAEALWRALAERRRQTGSALAFDPAGGIAVDFSTTMKEQQKKLLERIARLEQRVEELAASPTQQGIVLVDLSSAYMSLAATYSEAVATIVPLSKDDQAAIAALIQQADLDTEKRKQWSAILGGAAALVKAGLKVAAAVAAA